MPRLDPHVESFWAQFRASVGGDVDGRFYEAFHFGDSESSANELARLVLAGTKRATTSLVWAYEVERRPLPKPGDLSVVTDWDGKPLCVMETTEVAIMPFDEVGEDFAATEGEGDGSLRYWREVHWACFGRECKGLGLEPSPGMPVVCEEFEVIYRGA